MVRLDILNSGNVAVFELRASFK